MVSSTETDSPAHSAPQPAGRPARGVSIGFLILLVLALVGLSIAHWYRLPRTDTAENAATQPANVSSTVDLRSSTGGPRLELIESWDTMGRVGTMTTVAGGAWEVFAVGNRVTARRPDGKQRDLKLRPFSQYDVTALAPGEQRTFLAAANDSIYVCSLSGGASALLRRYPKHRPTAMTALEIDNGALLVVGLSNGAVELTRLAASDNVLFAETDPITLTSHNGAVRSVTIAPDQRWIASAAADGTVRVVTPRGTLLSALIPASLPSPAPKPADSIACSSNGRWLAATCDTEVALWNARTLVTEKRWNLPGPPMTAAAFSGDGSFLAAASSDVLCVWRVSPTLPAEKNAFILSPHRGGNVVGIAWSGSLLITAGEDGSVRHWRVSGL